MKRAVVICPGRGTYNKTELGYLNKYFPDKALLQRFDGLRKVAGQESISELDADPRFSIARHGRGDNASALIYASTLGDFQCIDTDAIEVVAVTGNSMGWYSALACAGALSAENGFTVSNTMGTFMQQALIGGQLVYPHLGDDWQPDPENKARLLALVDEINRGEGRELGLSIDLGGMLVLAGNETGLKSFVDSVPVIDGRFPMQLVNHAAFHTALQGPVAERGRRVLGEGLFNQPALPLIDGRGCIWWPNATNIRSLWDYTLGHQVTQAYDFTRAITVAAREFAPDLFIITGPGTTLGGAVAQSLIIANWLGLSDKAEFKSVQSRKPLLISMGNYEQRRTVISKNE